MAILEYPKNLVESGFAPADRVNFRPRCLWEGTIRDSIPVSDSYPTQLCPSRANRDTWLDPSYVLSSSILKRDAVLKVTASTDQ